MTELLVHRCFKEASPDLIAYYERRQGTGPLKLEIFRGYRPDFKVLSLKEESIQFMIESGEAVSLLNIGENTEHPFKGILLNKTMRAGFALPIETGNFLFFNFLHPYRFSFDQIRKIEALINRWRNS